MLAHATHSTARCQLKKKKAQPGANDNHSQRGQLGYKDGHFEGQRAGQKGGREVQQQGANHYPFSHKPNRMKFLIHE